MKRFSLPEGGSVIDIFAMVVNAKIAQTKWEKFPLKIRLEYIKRIKRYLTDNADEVAFLIASKTGKSLTEAMAAEVLPAITAANYYCKNIGRLMKSEKLKGGGILFAGKKAVLTKVPVGAVGIIVPASYPLIIPFGQIIAALLAGNTVLLKCSGSAALEIARACFDSAGFPEHVLNYVNAPGTITGDALIDAGIDKLFFTGSVRTGKYLMKQASSKLVPLVLQLGGNDPMIVCLDADLHRAASCAVWAGTVNGGRSASGAERIYVHQDVYQQFLDILKVKTENLRIGVYDDFNSDTAFVQASAKASVHIKDALAKGAEIFAQPKNLAGSKERFSYMVLTNVNHSMLLMQEETFAPVLGVMPFADNEEALQLANDSLMGLTASVWTKSKRNAAAIATKLNAGIVLINDHLIAYGMPHLPWGGCGESGFGKIHGKAGFDEMVKHKVVVKSKMPFAKRSFWWYPNSPDIYNGLKGTADCFYGYGIRNRISGLGKLLKVIPSMFRDE